MGLWAIIAITVLDVFRASQIGEMQERSIIGSFFYKQIEKKNAIGLLLDCCFHAEYLNSGHKVTPTRRFVAEGFCGLSVHLGHLHLAQSGINFSYRYLLRLKIQLDHAKTGLQAT